MGDDIIKEVDDEEERLPTPPPVGRRTQSMLDEVPPAIPLRTVNRLELVAEDPESMPLGQYDVVMGEQIQESSYDVVQDPNAASSVYEEPTPCKCMGLETYAPTLCMAMYIVYNTIRSKRTDNMIGARRKARGLGSFLYLPYG